MTWHPEVIEALNRENEGQPPEERIAEAAIVQATLELPRIRRAAVGYRTFADMTRRLSPRLHEGDVDGVDGDAAVWFDMMTPAGRIRVFSSMSVEGENRVSLDVDERIILLMTERSRLSLEQLQRRHEIEIEDAEKAMQRADDTRVELNQRGASVVSRPGRDTSA